MYRDVKQFTETTITDGSSVTSPNLDIRKYAGFYIHVEVGKATTEHLIEVQVSGRDSEPTLDKNWEIIAKPILDNDTKPVILELDTKLNWARIKITAQGSDIEDLDGFIGSKGFR